MNALRLLRDKLTKPSEFKYRPLNEEYAEIRLLLILPGEESTTIRCRLGHTAFHEDLMYSALSYCWGDPNDTRPILVNGKVIQVTVNLYHALLEIRKGPDKVVWIDAICINQGDDVEKGHQVARMRDIYTKAKRTFVWLGLDEEHNAQTAFEFMRSVAQDETYLQKALTMTNPLEDFAYTESRFIAFFNFCAVPYWKRTWIIQEILLSRYMTLLWGSEYMKFTLLVEFLDKLVTYSEIVGHKNIHLSIRFPLREIIPRFEFLNLHRRNRNYRHEILAVLSITTMSLATDPRDKIYGILALCQDADSMIGPADYKKDLTSLLRTFTMNAIVQRHRLDLICLNDMDKNPSNNGLPTWVVDWREFWANNLESEEYIFRESHLNMSDYSFRLLCNQFRTCGESMQYLSFSQDGNILVTDGFLFDIVSSLEDQKVKPDQVSCDHVYGTQICEALWRTLCMNCTPDGDKIGASSSAPMSPQLLDSKGKAIVKLFWTRRKVRLGQIEIFGRSIASWVRENYGDDPPSPSNDELKTFSQSLRWESTVRRKILTTAKGYLGLGHPRSRVGDLICLLPGATVPILLRPHGEEFTVVGEAYIHGIMEGEAWEARDESQMRQFRII